MAELFEDEIITATAASRAFSEILHRVCYGGESFVIKKGQRMMARIVPVTETMAPMETIQPAEAPLSTLDTMENNEEPLPQSAAPDEAEFYRAWMEQVRKVDA